MVVWFWTSTLFLFIYYSSIFYTMNIWYHNNRIIFRQKKLDTELTQLKSLGLDETTFLKYISHTLVSSNLVWNHKNRYNLGKVLELNYWIYNFHLNYPTLGMLTYLESGKHSWTLNYCKLWNYTVYNAQLPIQILSWVFKSKHHNIESHMVYIINNIDNFNKN